MESRYVSVNGLKIHYVTAGQAGPPVLLIHGLGMSYTTWRTNIDPLGQGLRVFAMDLAGHGDSDKPRVSYDLDFGLRFLGEFMDALGLERASMVGSSMGGLLAIAMALRYPQRVDRLVLADSSGLGRELHWLLRLSALPGLGLALSWPRRGTLRSFLRLIFYDPSMITEDLIDELMRIRRLPGSTEAIISMFRNGVTLRGVKPELVFLDRLPELRTPTLIVWGAQDQIFPLSHAYAAHARIPNAQLRIFDRCGHHPAAEYAEEFNQLVLAFLNDVGEASGGS